MPESKLAVENASVCFGSNTNRVRALKDVSLEFAAGELTLVMGPSGSGKTTLLSLLGCLQNPDRGRVFVNGTETGSLNETRRTQLRAKHIGFVFQAFRLFHALSAFENVMLAAEISRARDEQRCLEALELLGELGLGDKLDLKPNELSGGEKQRVAIARALLRKPDILLADEPTAALDSDAGRRICDILRKLTDAQNHTVVVVSHDPRWTAFAHRIVVLEDGSVVGDRRTSS
ncbi:MAG TPA: ABC transporter ATP-binding protein [Bryobacteraceae bacterium]|nr:ABC transporter ATP-binding protein [Bryobacteraceae bacterium]